LSVESFPEHLFIQDWLNANDPSTQRWLTSGRRNGIFWQWVKRTGLLNLQFDQGWLPHTEQEQRIRSFLVYAYQSITFFYGVFLSKYLFYTLLGSQWGWLPYDIAPTEVLPFVCEVPIRETYSILDNYRNIGTVAFLLYFS
jgi:hypothetical protein